MHLLMVKSTSSRSMEENEGKGANFGTDSAYQGHWHAPPRTQSINVQAMEQPAPRWDYSLLDIKGIISWPHFCEHNTANIRGHEEVLYSSYFSVSPKPFTSSSICHPFSSEIGCILISQLFLYREITTSTFKIPTFPFKHSNVLNICILHSYVLLNVCSKTNSTLVNCLWKWRESEFGLNDIPVFL